MESFEGVRGDLFKRSCLEFLECKENAIRCFPMTYQKINCFSAIFIVVWGADSAGLSMSLCFTFSQ